MRQERTGRALFSFVNVYVTYLFFANNSKTGGLLGATWTAKSVIQVVGLTLLATKLEQEYGNRQPIPPQTEGEFNKLLASTAISYNLEKRLYDAVNALVFG